MPQKDPIARRSYQRRLMARRRLLARVGPRFQRHADLRNCVTTRVIENFALWGQQFTPGEVCRLHLRLAARLEAAGLVELVRLERPYKPRKGRPVAVAGTKARKEVS